MANLAVNEEVMSKLVQAVLQAMGTENGNVTGEIAVAHVSKKKKESKQRYSKEMTIWVRPDMYDTIRNMSEFGSLNRGMSCTIRDMIDYAIAHGYGSAA